MRRFYNVLAQLGASRPALPAVVMRSMQIARLDPNLVHVLVRIRFCTTHSIRPLRQISYWRWMSCILGPS
jgi:hypothetical protein